MAWPLISCCKDTGLTYRLVGDHTIAIVKAARASRQRSDPPASPGAAGDTSSGSPNRDDKVDAGSQDQQCKQGGSCSETSKSAVATCNVFGHLRVDVDSTGRVRRRPPPSLRQLEEIVVTARKTRRVAAKRAGRRRGRSVSDQLQEQSRERSHARWASSRRKSACRKAAREPGAVITVRGVSSGSNDAGLDQSVAIEVDGVPISRGQVISCIHLRSPASPGPARSAGAVLRQEFSRRRDLADVGGSDRQLRSLCDARL